MERVTGKAQRVSDFLQAEKQEKFARANRTGCRL
jgi:hypothetical protein